MKNKRAIMALSTRYWALHPAKLEEISDFVAAQMAGEDTGMDLKELYSGDAGGGTDLRQYEVVDGVAVLPVCGVLDRRLNLFQAMSGGTSSQQIARRILEAAADDDVTGIVLDMDSPGGSVFAVEEIGDAIAEARQSKTVVAHTLAMMCSAAYWVGAQADKVIIGANAEIGSIGVVCVHYDRSEADRASGVRRTSLTAGKYKRIAGDTGPLSHEGQQYVQAQLDTYYSLFVDAVASGRGVSADTVLENMADGRTFIGEQAVAAGLADQIGNFETALAEARGERRERPMPNEQKAHTPEAPAAGATEQAPLTMDALKAEHPDLVQALSAEASAEATSAERARVLEILGAEAGAELTMTAVKDGMSTAEFYKAALTERRGEAEAAEDDLKAALQTSAGQEPKEKAPAQGADFLSMVDEYAAKNACTKTTAVKAVARLHPALHAAFVGGEEVSHG